MLVMVFAWRVVLTQQGELRMIGTTKKIWFPTFVLAGFAVGCGSPGDTNGEELGETIQALQIAMTASATESGNGSKPDTYYFGNALNMLVGGWGVPPYVGATNVPGIYLACQQQIPNGQLVAVGNVVYAKTRTAFSYQYEARQAYQCTDGAYLGWINSFTLTGLPASNYVFHPSTLGASICLTAPAPAAGVVVQLSLPAGHPSTISFPASVSIAAGSTCANFSIVTTKPKTQIAGYDSSIYARINASGSMRERRFTVYY
jgi:hypothetical protein